jgi:hypothetical protein
MPIAAGGFPELGANPAKPERGASRGILRYVKQSSRDIAFLPDPAQH